MRRLLSRIQVVQCLAAVGSVSKFRCYADKKPSNLSLKGDMASAGREREETKGSAGGDLSTQFADEEMNEEDLADFDVDEAAAQEIHDLARAIMEYSENRLQRGYCRRDVARADHLFAEMVDKMFGLMTPSSIEKMILSANRVSSTAMPSRELSDLQHRRDYVQRHLWSTATSPYPHMMKHAPVELTNVRADISSQQIEYAKALRDTETFELLFDLSESYALPGLGVRIDRKLEECRSHLSAEMPKCFRDAPIRYNPRKTPQKIGWRISFTQAQ